MITQRRVKFHGRGIRDKIKDELESRKTRDMKFIERIYKQDIFFLIAPRSDVSAKEIADSLGIAESTISKWRARLGMTNVRRIKPGPHST
jgi:DNA-binding CsgD family transcriptional regulator